MHKKTLSEEKGKTQMMKKLSTYFSASTITNVDKEFLVECGLNHNLQIINNKMIKGRLSVLIKII